MARLTPQMYARAVSVARIYLEELGFELLDHAVSYADLVSVTSGENRLIFVGSRQDPDLIDDMLTCQTRCPFEVSACDVLEITFSDDYESSTVEHFMDVLVGDGND